VYMTYRIKCPNCGGVMEYVYDPPGKWGWECLKCGHFLLHVREAE